MLFIRTGYNTFRYKGMK